MATNLHPFLHRRSLVLGALACGIGTPARAQDLAHAHRVIVAGAGMAGLSVAGALELAGLQVTVLEASPRIGGRNWTVRAGDTVPDLARQPQRCTFSEGQYLNAGAWRILPSHHRVLRCAERHGIALETLPDPAQAGAAAALQPAGGMDALPQALARALRTPVRTGVQVLGLERCGAPGRTGVVVWARGAHGLERLEADYAVLALPLGMCATLRMDLPPTMQRHLQAVQQADAIKIALETDGTWVDPPAAHGSHLILPPCGKQPVAQRIACVYGNDAWIARHANGAQARAVAQARSLLRPAALLATRPWGHPLVVQWSRQPFAHGAASRLPPGAASTLERLQQGMPPVFWASDALSPLNGWQEGALASAEQTVQALLAHRQRGFGP